MRRATTTAATTARSAINLCKKNNSVRCRMNPTAGGGGWGGGDATAYDSSACMCY